MPIRWTTTRLAEVRAMIADGKSAKEIAAAIGTTRSSVLHVAKKYDLGPWKSLPGTPKGSVRRSRLAPGGFVDAYATMSTKELMAHYSCGPVAITRWIAELGLTRPKGWHSSRCARTSEREPARAPAKLSGHHATAYRPNLHRPHRDHSLAGEAAEFLRGKGPIMRCNAQGDYDPKGHFWQRRISRLDGEQVVATARDLGWDPDAWQRLA